MERNIFEKQRDLNDRLNRYRDEYYNRNAPSVSDEVYDRLFDELKELEQETGIQMANSPTQTVGYPAVSRLEKTRHEIPLLSLDKTKSSMDLLNFMGEQQVMLMLKLDGLTVKLTYENGELRRLRNIYRMCIDYAFRPRLSSRLTLGGRTFPKKP